MAMEMTVQPSEDDIRRLVAAFYARVRQDALLGPVFAGAIGGSEAAWERHVARLCDFWSSVMLTSGRYHGDPFSAHLRLATISPPMFDRWLAVFGETCAELFAPPLAGAFCQRAERIARSLRMGLFERLPAARAARAEGNKLNIRRLA